MLLPAQYAFCYADLWSWFLVGDDWSYTRTPVITYLQNGKGAVSDKAKLTHTTLLSKLAQRLGDPGIGLRNSFNFNGFDYLPLSITRTFIGKACPWEVQETMQLVSQLGLLTPDKSFAFCKSTLGVDCGGLVANYWGIGVPHLKAPKPYGAWGISPRSFWSDATTWPDVKKRRRTSFSAISAGDAAIFFKDIINDDPDQAKKSDGKGGLVAGTGSEAFHIGLVNQVGAGAGGITLLEIAESSGAGSIWGGNGVNVRRAALTRSGQCKAGWVYAQTGDNERVYFVAPPAGWGPEMPYRYGEE